MTAPSGAVFLSYASQDAEAARRICESLRAAGIEVWFDQSELRGRDAWDQKIRRQIRECVLFVPIISAHTQARLEGYFRREWKLAVDRTHDMAEERAYLVPIVIDDSQDQNASVPDKFREVQWTRLPGGAMPPAASARIAALLGRPHRLAQASPRPLPPLARPRRFKPGSRPSLRACWSPSRSYGSRGDYSRPRPGPILRSSQTWHARPARRRRGRSRCCRSPT